MESSSIILKCKDFDAWVSFLGRLAKIGRNYIIKNDCYLACEKNCIPSTTEKYPGKHVIKDPFSIEDENYYMKDGTYLVYPIESLIDRFAQLKETDPTCRKYIAYFRNQKQIGVKMGEHTVIIAELLVADSNVPDGVVAAANSISDFNELITSVTNVIESKWIPFMAEELVHLRNNGVVDIWQKFDNFEGLGERVVKTRLARSLFCLAGVSRLNTPIANAANYAFLPSDQSDVAILRINALYKCGQSSNIFVNSVHEYLILVYNEE